MPLVDQGETYSFRLKVTDASGVAGAPGSTPTVLVTLPDNTTSSPTVTPNGTGIYDVDFTTTTVGRYSWTATATGGVLGTATRKWAGTLDVEDPATLLVDTSDALAHLRASGVIVSAADLEQLRWLCHRRRRTRPRLRPRPPHHQRHVRRRRPAGPAVAPRPTVGE
jgi:hypothetical protein